MPHAGSDVVAAKAAQVVNGKRRIPCRRIRRNMKDEVKMDANRLIAEVYKRPALWNQRHISYHNRELTNRVWMEIADIFKLPKPVLKAKWKGLRDTFRAELKKEQVYRKSKYRRNRPLWIHFESLQFLKEQMLPRPGTWDRSAYDEDDCDGAQRHHENGLNSDDNDYQRDYHDDDLTEHLLRSSIARSMENYGQQSTDFNETGERYNDLEYRHIGSPVQRFDDSETMLQTLSPDHVLLNSNGRDGNGDSDSSVIMAPWTEPFDHRDENYYFFVSLLPHMKQLPAERKMYLRMKIQELVYEEVYKKSSTSMSTSTEKDNPATP